MDDTKFVSLIDFRNSINMGLDIVFVLYGTKYNISWRNNKPFICICPDGNALFFDDVQSLLNNYKINGNSIKELWKDIVIEHM